MTTTNSEDNNIKEMMIVIDDCIKKDKLAFLANVICKLQREYKEVCELSTDGEYQITWTHKQVLDHITYNQRY